MGAAAVSSTGTSLDATQLRRAAADSAQHYSSRSPERSMSSLSASRESAPVSDDWPDQDPVLELVDEMQDRVVDGNMRPPTTRPVSSFGPACPVM